MNFKIKYQKGGELPLQKIYELFKSVEWESADFPDNLYKALSNNKNVFSAWEGDELIGLVSYLSDGMSVYVRYLLVKPKYQRLGIGTTLMNMMKRDFNNIKFVILNTSGETVNFYKKLGYKASEKSIYMYLDSEDINKKRNTLSYRKARINDLEAVANLVANLLGTCNIGKDKNMKDENEIINANKKEIEKDITKYYVSEIDNKVIGACGISDVKNENNYGLELGEYREILYLVVDNNYQKMGIGTELLKKCIENINEKIIYEARGDKNEVNSKALLEKLNFKLLKDLGDSYYKDHNYCVYCVNRDKNCNSCKAELWIKE